MVFSFFSLSKSLLVKSHKLYRAPESLGIFLKYRCCWFLRSGVGPEILPFKQAQSLSSKLATSVYKFAGPTKDSELGTLEVGLRICFNKSSRWVISMVKFENQCSRVKVLNFGLPLELPGEHLKLSVPLVTLQINNTRAFGWQEHICSF